MIFLGLTGSIGMGKTTVADAFASCGIPTFEADAVTHDLLGPNGAALPIVMRVFPEVVSNGLVDRTKLGDVVFRDAGALQKLEAIIHPLVSDQERVFRDQVVADGCWLAVFDIPLLFETGASHRFDYIAVVSAPVSIQRARVLKRAGMTEEKFEAIMARQVPDQVKRCKADFIIDTGSGKRRTFQHIQRIIEDLRVSGNSRQSEGGKRA
tara:strand:+ start:1205 stop:1831 length:627 start_codon:yes stop_codon:yes gene_type:complete